nr:winged helix-turn-helix transcriptional regulator [Lysinibacillus fusiformis]
MRKKYAQIPPKVEYSLFSKGKSIIPILDALCEWGEEQLQQISQGTMT